LSTIVWVCGAYRNLGLGGKLLDEALLARALPEQYWWISEKRISSTRAINRKGGVVVPVGATRVRKRGFRTPTRSIFAAAAKAWPKRLRRSARGSRLITRIGRQTSWGCQYRISGFWCSCSSLQLVIPVRLPRFRHSTKGCSSQNRQREQRQSFQIPPARTAV